MSADIIKFPMGGVRRAPEMLCQQCREKPATVSALYVDDEEDEGYLLSVCESCEERDRCEGAP